MLKFYVADFWDRLRPDQKCGSLINSFFSSRKERGVRRIRTRARVSRDICERRRKPEIFKRGVSPHKSRRKQDGKTFILSPNILSKSSISAKDERKTLNPPSIFSTTKKYWISFCCAKTPRYPFLFSRLRVKKYANGWVAYGQGCPKRHLANTR